MTVAIAKKKQISLLVRCITYGIVFVASFLLFVHPDIVETSNHSRILLDCIFDGRFFEFFDVVKQHDNSFYYLNNANYNIVFYLLFAAWELPVYLVGKIFSITISEQLMWMWAKALPALCSIVNAALVGKLVEQVKSKDDGSFAQKALLLSPIAFFFPVVMGQYETICIVFVLWALLYYIKGDMVRFAAVMGVAALCKSFALLIVVPLILLADKKLLLILRDLALSMFPTLLTGVLFHGRVADAEQFTN
ncbi:MAG: hypothetical protein GX683_05925, partial [Ruminococcaceae bacterium]|nr:hypothetical protein [Oscillospiraceae bacterium]